MFDDAPRVRLQPPSRHCLPMLSEADLRLAVLVGAIGAGCSALTTDDPQLVTFGSREEGETIDIRVETHRSEDHIELVLEAEISLLEDFEVVAEVRERLMAAIVAAAEPFMLKTSE